jgi:aminopeptidase YwaD
MRIALVAWLLLSVFTASAQIDVRTEGKRVVDTLTLPRFSGRGYNGGDKLAAQFILNRFAQNGLDTVRQPFPINVNTFSNDVKVRVGRKQLITGKSFIVAAHSQASHGTYKLKRIDFNKSYDSTTNKLRIKGKRKQWLWYDKEQIPSKLKKQWRDAVEGNKAFGANGVVEVTTGNLTMTMSQEVLPFTQVIVRDSAWNRKAKKITVDIDQQFLQPYWSQNVVGICKGTQHSDSFIVVSAHYDHLGKLGRDVYFPGANDNASGTAMMLMLSDSIAKYPLKYTTVFIGFSGEEAGLVGSKYFTEHPLIPLTNIKYLVNLDMNGTGEEGIKVVNGAVDTVTFKRLKTINEQNGLLLASVQPRGKAANSDHYHFSEAGVPAFFIYTLGGVSFYHDVYDRPETLEMPEFNDLHKLFWLFLRSF